MLSMASNIRLLGTVENLSKCLEVIAQRTPDVIIIDVQSLNRPITKNATDIVNQCRRVSNRIGFMVLTHYGNKRRFEFGLQLDIKGYCLKSIRTENLIQAVNAVADGEIYIHDAYLDSIGVQKAPEINRKLRKRQLEVLNLLLLGHTNHEIAEILHLSYETVRSHIRVILEKFNARDRAQVISIVLQDAVDFSLWQSDYLAKK